MALPILSNPTRRVRTETPEHRSWRKMIDRCENPNSHNYSYYGGRGIRICKRWRKSFETFLLDLGNRPTNGYSLDRIDCNGDYRPGNVRWSNCIDQANNRRSSVRLTYKGATKTIADWADELNMKYTTLHNRLKLGWTIDLCFTTPVKPARRGSPIKKGRRS